MKTLVILEQRNNQLKNSSLEAIAAAAKVSELKDVSALLIGSSLAEASETISNTGIEKLFTVESDELKDYQVLNYAKAAQTIIDELQPELVISVASPIGRDLLPRLAARYDSGILSDLVGLQAEADTIVGTKALYAGKCLSNIALKPAKLRFVSVRPNTFKLENTQASSSFSIEAKSVSLEATANFKLKELRASGSQKADLTEAQIIISGGRAMGSADAFKILHECAEPIQATVGASRAAVDSGYASHDMQVGQTGKTVNPKLYIACGISGSVQHMAGMRTSKTIVAINTDPEAPIFKIADYGIIGDLFEVVPVLTEKLRGLSN